MAIYGSEFTNQYKFLSVSNGIDTFKNGEALRAVVLKTALDKTPSITDGLLTLCEFYYSNATNNIVFEPKTEMAKNLNLGILNKLHYVSNPTNSISFNKISNINLLSANTNASYIVNNNFSINGSNSITLKTLSTNNINVFSADTISFSTINNLTVDNISGLNIISLRTLSLENLKVNALSCNNFLCDNSSITTNNFCFSGSLNINSYFKVNTINTNNINLSTTSNDIYFKIKSFSNTLSSYTVSIYNNLYIGASETKFKINNFVLSTNQLNGYDRYNFSKFSYTIFSVSNLSMSSYVNSGNLNGSYLKLNNIRFHNNITDKHLISGNNLYFSNISYNFKYDIDKSKAIKLSILNTSIPLTISTSPTNFIYLSYYSPSARSNIKYISCNNVYNSERSLYSKTEKDLAYNYYAINTSGFYGANNADVASADTNSNFCSLDGFVLFSLPTTKTISDMDGISIKANGFINCPNINGDNIYNFIIDRISFFNKTIHYTTPGQTSAESKFTCVQAFYKRVLCFNDGGFLNKADYYYGEGAISYGTNQDPYYIQAGFSNNMPIFMFAANTATSILYPNVFVLSGSTDISKLN